MTTAAPLLEVCVESVDGALAAAAGGADRVELCADLLAGGTTPSAGAVAVAVARCKAPVMVMVRPRGGDFVYGAVEREVMARDVEIARERGAAGVVLGALTRDGDVDADATARLIERARPLEVTFHRAFDHTRDPHAALDELVALGVDRILTSGHAPSAPEGAERIAALIERAEGRLSIMPGCGVRAHNVVELVERTGAREVHFSAGRLVRGAARHHNPAIAVGTSAPRREDQRYETDADAVRQVRAAFDA